jgi:hypothetical protein
MNDRYGRIEKSNLPFMFGWLAINNLISVASCVSPLEYDSKKRIGKHSSVSYLVLCDATLNESQKETSYATAFSFWRAL